AYGTAVRFRATPTPSAYARTPPPRAPQKSTTPAERHRPDPYARYAPPPRSPPPPPVHSEWASQGSSAPQCASASCLRETKRSRRPEKSTRRASPPARTASPPTHTPSHLR